MRKFILIITVLLLLGCEKDVEPDIDNDPEVITTVKMIMEPNGGITDAVFVYEDPDGAGGTEPMTQTDTLFVNTTYEIRVYVLNQMDSLNQEIFNEAQDHQFFLSFDPQLGISHSYRDADVDGDPLGLRMQVVTGSDTGLTEMELLLIHEPEKDAENVSEGDPTNADGDIDFLVSWPVYLQ